MTEAEADLVLKVSSALHGERLWRRVGTRGYANRDERSVALALWQSTFVICGGPFEVALPSSISSVEGSNSFLTTTCPAHRMTLSEVGKLRFAKKADRPALFEAMRQRKLAAPPAERKWRFRSREDRFEMVSTLWLYPELNCSSCVNDADDQSGTGQLAYYVDYVQRGYPEWWEADAVPIYWSVRGEPGIADHAPNSDYANRRGDNFLTFWTPPVDAKTGELLNWWRLPVRNDRFPAFAKALGWLPSPFQEFAPLRSILTNATQAVRSPEPMKG